MGATSPTRDAAPHTVSAGRPLQFILMEQISPMTLGNMRENGVRSLPVRCTCATTSRDERRCIACPPGSERFR